MNVYDIYIYISLGNFLPQKCYKQESLSYLMKIQTESKKIVFKVRVFDRFIFEIIVSITNFPGIKTK